MHKSWFLPMCLVMATWGLAGQHGDVTHYDHRETPHLQFNPAHEATTGLEGEARAFEFLASNADTYGLNVLELELADEKTSLLGTHYHYRQTLHGLPVMGGEITVSIAHDGGHIYRIYNNIYPASQNLVQPRVNFDQEAAYDLAWQHLGVTGQLLWSPSAELAWRPEGENFRLVWVVQLHTSQPAGDWQTLIDAAKGAVIESKDSRITRKPSEARPQTNVTPIDRAAAFARFEAQKAFQQLERETQAAKASLADGTGVVFDPDPRTTLNDESLVDTSAASAFTAAYLNRPLEGIELNGGTYSLNGPWINILDWDPPTNPPSTTTTGNWTATRGDNAFNDATTYFHINQSQVYIQSLGFTGATGIQEGSIGTDTDGANGADNSFYTSGANRMSFGHGCVDDNEDADVILHEYGHAIHYSINSNWGGGDAGAIGEGFGDYWAGSYSYSTPNGPVFHPEWVFTWDGHSSCWGGRFLDKTTMMYDPSQTYGAHQSIPGGQSDELWSAPVFQSFLDLIGLGRAREEMDQIVLESHFGLGSGVTMRVLGNATVAAAAALFPGGPHADTYTTRFLAQNIIDIPHVAFEADGMSIASETGSNGVADPGETVGLKLRLANTGNLDATQVSAILSSMDPSVTINAGTSDYPNINLGAVADNTTDFVITLDPEMMCGDTVDLTLQVDWTDGSLTEGTTTVTYTLSTGIPEGVEQTSTPALSIPDNTTVMDVMSSTAPGTVTANLNIDVDISHTYTGDLEVTLQAPDGTQVILHDNTGGTADDIIGNYPGTLTPAQSLSALLGKSLTGDWTLIITDSAGGDTGTLNSWTLRDVSSYTCEDSVLPCLGDLDGDRVVDMDDYGICMAGWFDAAGDVDGNGIGSILDMMLVTSAFGNCD